MVDRPAGWDEAHAGLVGDAVNWYAAQPAVAPFIDVSGPDPASAHNGPPGIGRDRSVRVDAVPEVLALSSIPAVEHDVDVTANVPSAVVGGAPATSPHRLP